MIKQMFNKTKVFIYRNARPLGFARWHVSSVVEAYSDSAVSI